jgi:hypothetical protein
MMLFPFHLFDFHIHNFDTPLVFAPFNFLILSRCYHFVGWSNLKLETVSVIEVLLSLDQQFESKLIRPQVINGKDLDSLVFCLDNVAVGGHHSLDGEHPIITDLE